MSLRTTVFEEHSWPNDFRPNDFRLPREDKEIIDALR